MQGRQSFTDGEVQQNERVRLYEVAKEIGLPNKELVDRVRSMGIEVKNYMSTIDLEQVERLKRAIEKERLQNREVKRISATVVRRRSKGAPKVPVVAKPVADDVAQEPSSGPAPVAEPDVASVSVLEEPAPRAVESVPEPPPVAELVALPEEQAVSSPSGTGASSARQQTAPIEVAEEHDAGPSVEPAPAVAEVTMQATPVESVQKPVISKGETDKEKPVEKAEEEKKKPPVNLDDLPINSPLRRKALPKREIRFAPGFKPQQQQQQQQRRAAAPRPATASEAQPLSAADALKMMAPAPARRRAQQVVITDLDRRQAAARPGQDRRFRGGRRKKKQAANRRGKKTEITTPAEHKRVIRMADTASVGDIARQMGAKSTQVLSKLWGMGMTNVMITHSIDAETASLLANEFGYEIEDVSFKEANVLVESVDSAEDLEVRAPVITVMGHVDHGKTSLLDAIRGSKVTSGEAGGITQHMGAYRVKTGKRDVVFLDTPGHAAFTAMRARGAQATDIVVLVVAADDGVMPQTVEAIDHSRDAGVPIVVAINKIDRADANRDRVMSELGERKLVPEAWGGDTLFVPVSAITKEGVDDLLESLLLQADLLELKANPKKPAKGTVVEARMDRARGAMCTILVQDGTLRVGDTVVVGEHLGKVRAMLDEEGESVKEAGPSVPVEVLGLSGIPEAGDALNAVVDDKAARQLAEHRHEQKRKSEIGSVTAKTYEDILGALQNGNACELKLLIKSDVQGSSEAIRESLKKLSTDKVEVNVVSAGVGGIHETDINLAKASGAIIVGFNVRAGAKASQLAEREGVELRIYDVIYELLDDTKDLMRGLLPKEKKEKFMGRAEVRQTFMIPKVGMVAGCAVLDGKISRKAHVRLIRANVKIFDGKFASLRRFKDDVREVQQGYECGIGIEGYNKLQENDIIEAYEVEEVTPDL